MKKLLLAIAIALALPAVAEAGLVTMVARDVPLAPRALASASAPGPFNMLGIHWRGTGTVEYRTRSTAGAWSAWRAGDDDAGPNLTSSERHVGWRDGSLVWVGPSDAVRFRTSGPVSRVRAYYVWSKVTTRAVRALSVAGSPAIVPRSGWEADEKIKRAKPYYAPALKLAIVHHTAGTNSYTPAQSAAIVRGIEIYHVKANGWNDIGYNFLVDRYGTVYEGRAGGIERNVIGAHSLGFNTGTVGVSLIGNFEVATPPPAMRSALVKLLAWRLDVAHVDPLSRVVYTSGGNSKFHAGKVVTLPAISGHRDTGPTACPGKDAYALLPALTKRVSLLGLPKLYSPVVSGTLSGTVRFQARLSAALPWTVSVTDAAGAVVAERRGRGTTVDWRWAAAGAGRGPFAWSIAAGPTVLPASGTLGTRRLPAAPAAPAAPVLSPAPSRAPAPAPSPATPVAVPAQPVAPVVALTGVSVAPALVAPGLSGTGMYLSVDFTLGVAAPVTVQLTGGATPLTLLSAILPAGENSFSWDLSAVPDGRYSLVVAASPTSGAAETQAVPVVVDRTLTGYSVTPPLLSPNGDGLNDTAVFGFTLSQSVPVQLLIERGGVVAATAYAGQLGPGPQSITWNGTSSGVLLPDGTYDAVVVASDSLGTVSLSLPVTVDATAPVLTLLDASALRFELSEAATVTVSVNGQPIASAQPAGSFTIPWQDGPIATVSAQAADAAGNQSAVVTSP